MAKGFRAAGTQPVQQRVYLSKETIWIKVEGLMCYEYQDVRLLVRK